MVLASRFPGIFRVKPLAFAPPTAVETFIASVGSSRISFIYHKDYELIKSGGNLVSWNDVRGNSAYGPTLLPNGGNGGTAPTVDGSGRVVTNGSSSYIANATASAKFPIDTSKRAFLIIGEMTGTPTAWGGMVSTLSAPTYSQVWGSSGGSMQINGIPIAVAKAQPGSGVESCWLMANRRPETWTNAPQTSEVTVYAECIGRGPAKSIAYCTDDSGSTNHNEDHAVYGSGTGFLCMGRADSNYGVVKARCLIGLNTDWTYADRVALEILLAAEGVAMYTPSGSRGLLLMMGDSITQGSFATTPTFATPANPSATNPAGYMQAALDAANKPIDTAAWGLGGQNLNTVGKVQSPNTVAWVNAQLAFLSPARRAAGLKEVVLIAWGTNDIGNQGRSSAQIYTDITTLVAAVHACGSKCVVCTVVPRGNFNGTENSTRLALNVLIEANTAGADAVAVHRLTDVGGGVKPFDDTAYPSSFNLTYYRSPGDLTHMKDAGSAAWKTAPYSAMNTAGII